VERTQPAVLAPRLMRLATGMPDQEDRVRGAVTQAVASMVNKAAQGAEAAWVDQLHMLGGTAPPSGGALACVGAVAAGLVARGAPQSVAGVTDALVSLLRSQQPGQPPAVAAAAAAALAAPLQGLTGVKHTVVRPLAAQRYFSSLLPMLIVASREATGEGRAALLLGACAPVYRCASGARS
jgi:hypothetical protein